MATVFITPQLPCLNCVSCFWLCCMLRLLTLYYK